VKDLYLVMLVHQSEGSLETRPTSRADLIVALPTRLWCTTFLPETIWAAQAMCCALFALRGGLGGSSSCSDGRSKRYRGAPWG